MGDDGQEEDRLSWMWDSDRYTDKEKGGEARIARDLWGLGRKVLRREWSHLSLPSFRLVTVK